MKSWELAMKEAQCGFQFATIWRLNTVQMCKPRLSECNRCWNLFCMRRSLEHCSLMCKLECAWVAATAPSFISSTSSWSSEDTKHLTSSSLLCLQWSRPVWRILCLWLLPSAAVLNCLSVVSGLPAEWREAGPLVGVLPSLPPATVVEASFSGETSWEKHFHSLGSKSGGVHF